jgi:hypothetical protein
MRDSWSRTAWALVVLYGVLSFVYWLFTSKWE